MLRSIRPTRLCSETLLHSPRLGLSIHSFRSQHITADEEKLRQIIASSNLASNSTSNSTLTSPSNLLERKHSRPVVKGYDKANTRNDVTLPNPANAGLAQDARTQIRSLQDSTLKDHSSKTGATFRLATQSDRPNSTSSNQPPSSSKPHDRPSITFLWHSFLKRLSNQKSLVGEHVTFARNAYYVELQNTIARITQTLNDITGYTEIEVLKDRVLQKELELEQSRTRVKEVKAQYTDAIATRLHLQREVNELLTRKHNWLASDLERFTDLYRSDHANEVREQETQEQLLKEEQLMDRVQLLLTHLILTRYHEEQIWSDKIRRALTYGTVILMGLNALLFIVATLFVEPWKRKRLVAAFEEKVSELLMESPQTIESNVLVKQQKSDNTDTQGAIQDTDASKHDIPLPKYDPSAGVVPFLSKLSTWTYSKVINTIHSLTTKIHAFNSITPDTPLTLTFTKANATLLVSSVTIAVMVLGVLVGRLL